MMDNLIVAYKMIHLFQFWVTMLLTQTMTTLHKADYEQMNDEELFKEAERLFYVFKISDV